ncbi:hypothetical protein [Caenimonas aquaedulcis]|uniref:Uncharacterized protein n=1 Tax=Caenimonas aquaedulcis TaxID=2793270 RepID=A0A931H580_9BURK|nr:hypothetical protein [Caenimonas aquaedulcis]MBG9388650.1 hypothetical protein [Caenimonas aquaedulcis]
MHKLQLRSAAVVLAASALLAGCGGGGDDAPATARTTDVPGSAQSSVDGLIAYLQELIAQTSETTEPVLVGDAVLPTSDTTEPAAVN